MTDVLTTVIVSAAAVVNVREFSRRMGKVDLDGMFLTGLAQLGSQPGTPPTHFISSGGIRPAYIEMMSSPQRLFDKAKAAWENDGDVFPFTLAQVTTALSKCIVSDGTFNGEPEGPHELIARLGYQIIQVVP